MALEEIYLHYYEASDVEYAVFCLLWNDIAESFSILPGLIRPNDRFGEELPYRTDDEDLILNLCLARHLKEEDMRDLVTPKTIKTVDDYIRLASRFAVTGERGSSGR
jgi:hypothetical protein